MGDKGLLTILSPKYATEIGNIKALSLDRVIEHELYSHLKGFNPFIYAGAHVFQGTVRKKMTQALGSVTKPVSEEASLALENNWTNNPDWHSFPLAPSLLRQIAQQSSRVFLGETICRNPDWLRIATDYTTNSFRAAEELPDWPGILHPILVRVLDSTRKMQRDFQGAQDIIKPVLKERRKIREAARLEGRPPPVYNDALEWMEQASKGEPYDPTAAQLLLSTFSLHTTADMITQAVFDLCGKEDLIYELRKEVVTVLSQEGWKKVSLNKLHLMDSFLKESQRLKPLNIATLRRIAEEDVELSDGTKIAKGTSLFIPTDWMRDANFYENPETFDPYRFLKQRQIPGGETRAQLIVPAAEHMGFGLGIHACPGRFMASNSIKIALCHILVKYDFKLPEGSVPKQRRHGGVLQADPEAEIMVRRRQEEISLEDICNIP
ncbi:hypothetical protein N7499_004048 [Penicillium canescens]|uniref:Uncharacterized protein n=1 Tax=Penicillium canescens TaxID=5083 RepID=A0AAD6ILU4_PENCN|nr:uncharacterized protein N7446_007561 [Penicillium canescens]KAJ5991634.1 hypothetical protein N7522_011841 [Penicillium canescens]KAJ6052915.1 hypothetical protein N7460_003449 [Penicillium canescens]KAJ6063441.1 hypothetical protein N7446_007561 [Penicillium canescens]KAJ6089201.1 hypothetical protein N7499_004048 [Penicillium canescens]